MWEMHGFPHKFTTVRENATKIMVWRKPGKLILVLFPQYGCFFPSDSLPMVYFSIGKCMRFLSNFPQYGKVQQNPWYGESLGIDTHTFFIVWVLFSHSIPILWYISLYEKCMGFSMNFPQYAKMQQNPWYGESL